MLCMQSPADVPAYTTWTLCGCILGTEGRNAVHVRAWSP